MRVAAENGGEIEAKAIDMIFRSPVAETVENEVSPHRMVAIEGVATATEIEVVPIGSEEIISFVVEPSEGNNRAGGIAFGGVVEDDIKDDLNPGRVEFLDQLLELVDFPSGMAFGGKPGLGGMEGQGAVAPIVG